MITSISFTPHYILLFHLYRTPLIDALPEKNYTKGRINLSTHQPEHYLIYSNDHELTRNYGNKEAL